MNDLKYRPGDYIRYILKNEVGKIKRLNALVDNHAFCWYHTGDTAASTPYSIIEPVLLQEQADSMTHDEIAAYLHKLKFSNDYAIDEIVGKQEER